MKKSIYLVLFCFLLLLFVSCNPDVINHKGQKVVTLVVGLDYKQRYNALTALKFKDGVKEYYVSELRASLRDSKEVGAALDELYTEKNVQHETIFMLSESDRPDYSSKYYPNADNVMNKIKSLELDEDDLFVFFYAGHGYYSGNEMYLLLGDTSISCNYCSYITSSNLLSTIKELPCRSVIILDSCFSGVADPGNSPSSETLLYSLNSMLKERINTESEIKLSVICASKWNEESLEGYYVKTNDGPIEEHGQFSGRLLSVLGWKHSSKKTTTVNQGTENEIVASGYISSFKGSLSLDEIYSKILDGWTYPNMKQHPVLYYTNESINLIPVN